MNYLSLPEGRFSCKLSNLCKSTRFTESELKSRRQAGSLKLAPWFSSFSSQRPACGGHVC